MTTAKRLSHKPLIAEAKKLFLQAMAEHQKSITGIRPADPALRAEFEQMVDEFGSLRGAPLFYPYIGSGIGRGALVELADGSVKYDFISGIGVHHLGHGNPELLEAAFDAACSDLVMQGNLQQNIESFELSKELISAAGATGAKLEHCILSTSGAMANENALKMAFQKKYPADRILAFDHCFSGRTLSLAQITDKPDYRVGLPSTLSVDYVPFFDPSKPEESERAALDAIKAHLARYPGKHAAMIFELVLGEGGFYPGNEDFFRSLMNLLKSNDVVIIVDEIQTFARTPELFAFRYFKLDDLVDIVTVGKSLQVCATLFRDELNPKPGLISQTFTGCTSAIFGARRILSHLLKNDYFGPSGKIAALHDYFSAKLSDLSRRKPQTVQGPFGIGAMIAFTPFGGNHEQVKKLLRLLFEKGVIAFYAGSAVSRVRFLIPVGAVTFDDIDTVCNILEAALEEIESAG